MQNSEALKKRTAWLSILSNTVLVLLKLLVGISTGAVSLISEALHSGIDLLAALIAFWAVHKSAVPPDMEHDYGHGKYENISSAIEAVLILAAACGIIAESVKKFSQAEPPQPLPGCLPSVSSSERLSSAVRADIQVPCKPGAAPAHRLRWQSAP